LKNDLDQRGIVSAVKLFDANGEPLFQGAVKGQRRYRYYVSKRLVRGKSQEPEQQWRTSRPNGIG